MPDTQRAALSVDEWCRSSDMGRTLTYSEIACGRLKSVKVGGRRLIPASERHAYFDRLLAIQEAADTGRAT